MHNTKRIAIILAMNSQCLTVGSVLLYLEVQTRSKGVQAFLGVFEPRTKRSVH